MKTNQISETQKTKLYNTLLSTIEPLANFYNTVITKEVAEHYIQEIFNLDLNDPSLNEKVAYHVYAYGRDNYMGLAKNYFERMLRLRLRLAFKATELFSKEAKKDLKALKNQIKASNNIEINLNNF